MIVTVKLHDHLLPPPPSLSLLLLPSLSPEYATIDSPPRRSCIGLRSLRHMCSWHRLFVLVISVVPLLYLVAIEIAFKLNKGLV